MIAIATALAMNAGLVVVGGLGMGRTIGMAGIGGTGGILGIGGTAGRVGTFANSVKARWVVPTPPSSSVAVAVTT